ncbi:MAG: hypothetical protein V1874_08895 [Spirochaetota bacterium]
MNKIIVSIGCISGTKDYEINEHLYSTKYRVTSEYQMLTYEFPIPYDHPVNIKHVCELCRDELSIELANNTLLIKRQLLFPVLYLLGSGGSLYFYNKAVTGTDLHWTIAIILTIAGTLFCGYMSFILGSLEFENRVGIKKGNKKYDYHPFSIWKHKIINPDEKAPLLRKYKITRLAIVCIFILYLYFFYGIVIERKGQEVYDALISLGIVFGIGALSYGLLNGIYEMIKIVRKRRNKD